MNYILMADVVESRKLNGAALKKSFTENVAAINKQFRPHLLSPLTITLGDEFQGVVDTLEESVAIIIALEEAIALSKFPFKLRYVLHYGKINTPVNKKIAHGMLGEGLTQARERLIAMKKEKRARFSIELKKETKNKLLNDSFLIFQSLTDEWKAKDSKVIKAFLETDNYREAALLSERDISLFWRREKTLRIREYKTICSLIRQISSLK